MQVNFKKWTTLAFVAGPLLLGPSAGFAQYERGHQQHQDFYNGAYNTGRGGTYDRGTDYRGGYGYNGDNRYHGDDRYRDDRGHGIGTGKGAAIGGAGGAALGAIFGGGLKGALIGGAAGAGIGAVAGHAHQENQRRNDYYRGH